MVDQNPKRSGEPPVWLMFGAGGTVSAIFFPVVILILGLLLPFGLIDPHNLITFAYSWIGKLVILVLTIFPMWCGLHRIHHAMHDLKIHVPAGGFIFYGLAMIYTIWVLFAVIGLEFKNTKLISKSAVQNDRTFLFSKNNPNIFLIQKNKKPDITSGFLLSKTLIIILQQR